MTSILKKETIIYGFGRLFGSSISFFLLPFYTHALGSPGEYGVVQIIIAFIAFSNIVFLFGFDGALMKYYVASKKEINKKAYLTNTYLWVAVFGLVVLLVLIAFRSLLATFIIAGYDSSLISKIAFILFFDALRSIHLLVLRAENRAAQFTVVMILDILLLACFNVFFVGVKGLGVAGVVHANFLSSSFLFLLTLPVLKNKLIYKTISFSRWNTLRQFAAPLMPAGLFWMILEFADRKMLEFLLPNDSLHTVGIYGAGYKLGSLMLLLVYAFNYAWRPYFLKENNVKSFRKISSYFFWGLGLFFVLLVLFVDAVATTELPFVGSSLIDSRFWEGLTIVPIIALAYIFHGSFILQEAGPFLTNTTYKISVCRFLGVIINITLNLLFIPYFEKPYLGASLATLIAYFLMASFLYFWNYKSSQLRYDCFMISIVTANIFLAWYLSIYGSVFFKFLLPFIYILQFKYYIRCHLSN